MKIPPNPLFPKLALIGLVGVNLIVGLSVSAAPFVVAKSSLQPPQVIFSEVASFTLLNNLTINGFTFTQNMPTVTMTAPAGNGPGITNNLSGDIALSIANPLGYALTVILPGASTAFGFGFALIRRVRSQTG